LIPEGRLAVFRAGVFAFLAGHVAFAAAFLTQPRSLPWLAVAAVTLVLALSGVWRWLSPRLPEDMRRPVQAYFLVIGVMTALACAVSGAGGPPIIAAGAIAFTASDIAVARDRFVRQEFANRAWGVAAVLPCAGAAGAESVRDQRLIHRGKVDAAVQRMPA
jgi:uncharacterized membrane protein YhhN